MATQPEVAAEVSLTPLAAGLPVDGIIFFSDILTLPYGMGIPITIEEKVGPVATTPLRTLSDFAVFEKFSAEQHTPFVGQALQKISASIPVKMAVLGFAGAPWTVACYLTEGKSGKKFEAIRNWKMHSEHVLAQEKGRSTWYRSYKTRICKVERDYEFGM
jgi:uroporphyrinogen decarboxylase